MASSVDDDSCAVCKIVIPIKGDGLYCDGFCGKWYHPSCLVSPIPKKEYQKINDIGKHVQWYCDPCAVKIGRIVAGSRVWDFEDLISVRSKMDELLEIVKGIVSENIEIKSNVQRLNLENLRLSQARVAIPEVSQVEKKKSVNQSLKLVSETISLSKIPEEIRATSMERSKETKQDDVAPLSLMSKESTIHNLQPSGVKGDGGVSLGMGSESSDSSISIDPAINDKDFPSLDESSSDEWKVKLSRKNRKLQRPSPKMLNEVREVDVTNHRPTLGSNRPNRSMKPSNRNRVIFGMAKPNDGIVAVSRKSWVFISRLAPTVDIESVKKYAVDLCEGNEVLVEQLPTKYQSYKSIKLGCLSEYVTTLLSPENWSEGILVSKYIPPKLAQNSRKSFQKNMT